MTYAVVLAGGGGTRLWPLSTPEVPKPFLPLLGDQTMLARTVSRLLEGDELGLTASDITVVADERYAPLVASQTPGVRFLAEPLACNTAPAIALAAMRIERPWDEVMLVLPADHHITAEAAFRARLALAAAVAAGHGPMAHDLPLVTLGIMPDRPATEYGYLLPARAGDDVARLAAFEEKPEARRAVQLVATPGVAWNAGVFAWQRGTIANVLAARASEVWRTVADAPPDRDGWRRITPISLDYAVMEGAALDGQVVMVRASIGWTDIGGWTALLRALEAPIAGATVVPAGATAHAAPGDLVVRRSPDGLHVEPGPLTFRGHDGPVTVLHRAEEARPVIEALVERVRGYRMEAGREPVAQGGRR